MPRATASRITSYNVCYTKLLRAGEALTERKHAMQRAYRDLVDFHTTQESLRLRRDRNGSVLFDQFLT